MSYGYCQLPDTYTNLSLFKIMKPLKAAALALIIAQYQIELIDTINEDPLLSKLSLRRIRQFNKKFLEVNKDLITLFCQNKKAGNEMINNYAEITRIFEQLVDLDENFKLKINNFKNS